MKTYETLQRHLQGASHTWLVTGVAGFIGSNLLETLLKLNQRVVGLDNFVTGNRRNIDEVRKLLTPEQWARFTFIEGDICDLLTCRQACSGADYILHHAALGSVPRSIEDPITTNQNNVDGFLNMLVAARDAKARHFIYAASSSTYGDHPDLPKVEDKIGKPLSPYAVTKYVNELYADVFARTYGFKTIGLRYFNVFGKRQDPEGAYAAVIPKWVAAMIRGEEVIINGNGETSRDFCHVANVVQANLLAATIAEPAPLGRGRSGQDSLNQVYNIAVGERTNLNTLFKSIQTSLRNLGVIYDRPPSYREFRSGDVLHSQADVTKARSLLGYESTHDIGTGIEEAMPWYLNFLK